jgi:hypothetical protein
LRGLGSCPVNSSVPENAPQFDAKSTPAEPYGGTGSSGGHSMSTISINLEDIKHRQIEVVKHFVLAGNAVPVTLVIVHADCKRARDE